jgi:anaerobic selenocysteine-containing dehydrogenase
VVIDFFQSETCELADVVLPGSVWCEDEGTTTNLFASTDSQFSYARMPASGLRHHFQNGRARPGVFPHACTAREP